MKIYLQEKDGAWKPYEGTLDSLSGELKSREIDIHARATVGEWATVGARATVGEGANIKSLYGCIVMGPLGSRQAPMTAYPHKGTIWIGTGCFLGSIADFESAVRKNHAGTNHETEYLTALKYVREKYK